MSERHCILCQRSLRPLHWWERGKWNPLEPPPLCLDDETECHRLFDVRVGVSPS